MKALDKTFQMLIKRYSGTCFYCRGYKTEILNIVLPSTWALYGPSCPSTGLYAVVGFIFPSASRVWYNLSAHTYELIALLVGHNCKMLTVIRIIEVFVSCFLCTKLRDISHYLSASSHTFVRKEAVHHPIDRLLQVPSWSTNNAIYARRLFPPQMFCGVRKAWFNYNVGSFSDLKSVFNWRRSCFVFLIVLTDFLN